MPSLFRRGAASRAMTCPAALAGALAILGVAGCAEPQRQGQPAFYRDLAGPEGAAAFIAVHQQLVSAGTSQGLLTSVYNQAYLLQNLDNPTLVVGGGISAIPSVHNAMAVLFALVSFRMNRALGIAMSAFAGFIWVASVYLNWHYAVDGLAGGIGAVVLWKLSGAMVDRRFAASSFACDSTETSVPAAA